VDSPDHLPYDVFKTVSPGYNEDAYK